MARLLLAAASAALLVSTSATAAVLVVRSSGPSAGAYPPGKALSDTHKLNLKANDTIVLLDSRGTRTLQRARQLQRLGQRRSLGRSPNGSAPPPAGSGWGPSAAPALAASGRPTSTGRAMSASPTPSELTLYRGDATKAGPRHPDRRERQKGRCPFRAKPMGRRLALRLAGHLGQQNQRIGAFRAGHPDASRPVPRSVGARRHGAKPDPGRLPGAARRAHQHLQRPVGRLALQ